MAKSSKRGGVKAHNKRIKKRNEIFTHIEYLKKKIIEEAKERYIQEQQNKDQIKIQTR